MRAALIHRYGGPEQVKLEEIPDPVPGEDDLLVRVRAASINPVDYKIRDGGVKALIKYRFPLVLGNDCAGVVEAVGAKVTRFAVGDEIYARLDKQRIGAWADKALVSEGAAARKPASIDMVAAASLPLVGLTAWQALIDIGRLARGQRVLVHAGSGGVGTFAIQLAKHLGAEVLTTVGARNVELVKRLGADVAIDYRADRFEDRARDCDVVFDTQGEETLLRSFDCVKRGGVVITVGGKPDAKFAKAWGASPVVVLALRFLMRKPVRRAEERGARFEYLFMRADGAQLEEIARLVDEGIVKPIVDRTFPLAEVKEALAYVEGGHATGKVVLTL